jgi:peroxiredoxin
MRPCISIERKEYLTVKPRQLLLAAVVCAVLGGAAVAYKVMAPEQVAPAMNVTTITGEAISDAQWRGKVVLVNFWATSCVTCVAEMPLLVDLHKKYSARGFETLAVAMAYDRPDYVLNFAKTRQLPFKVALDLQAGLAKSYGNVAVTPTSFLIDKQGKIIKRWVGEPDIAAVSSLIERSL